MTTDLLLKVHAKVPWLSALVRKSAFPWICLALWCLVGGAVRAIPKFTVLCHISSGTDYFIPLCGAWGLEQGLKLHSDMSSPLGVLFYAPYCWCAKITGMCDQVLKYTQGALFILISVISFVALRPPRFPWAITAIVTAYLGLSAMNPCLTEDYPFIPYEGAAYNHLAFVLGELALLVALFPLEPAREKGATRTALDGAIIAFLITWEFFVKPNLAVMDIFLVAVGLLLFYWAALRPGRVFYASLFSCLIVFTFAVIFYFDLNLADMVEDLRMASSSRGHTVMRFDASDSFVCKVSSAASALYLEALGDLREDAWTLVPFGFLFIGGLTWAAGRSTVSRRFLIIILGFLGILFCVDMVRPLFNTCTMALEFFWILCFCFFNQLKAFVSDMRAKQVYRVLYGLLLCVVVLNIGKVFSAQITGMACNLAAPSRFPPRDQKISAFRPDEHIEGGHFEHLCLLCSGVDRPGVSFAKRLNMGIDLIRKHDFSRKAIMDFDFENPFPMLLNAPYPSGQPIWLDGGGTFDLSNHLSPEAFFKGTEVILDPLQTTAPPTKVMLNKIYGGYVREHFTVVDENECWRLMAKVK